MSVIEIIGILIFGAVIFTGLSFIIFVFADTMSDMKISEYCQEHFKRWNYLHKWKRRYRVIEIRKNKTFLRIFVKFRGASQKEELTIDMDPETATADMIRQQLSEKIKERYFVALKAHAEWQEEKQQERHHHQYLKSLASKPITIKDQDLALEVLKNGNKGARNKLRKKFFLTWR